MFYFYLLVFYGVRRENIKTYVKVKISKGKIVVYHLYPKKENHKK